MRVCVNKCLGICLLCISILVRTDMMLHKLFSEVKCAEFTQEHFYVHIDVSPPWVLCLVLKTDRIMNLSVHKCYFGSTI